MLTDIHIDILAATGEKGGVETVVNKSALYLREENPDKHLKNSVISGIILLRDM